MSPARWSPAVLALSLSLHGAPVAAQSAEDFERAHLMLAQMKHDIEVNYYDSTFHGVNLAERYRVLDAQLNTAESRGDLMGILAQFLLDLNDSHTTFDPPAYAARLNYGWVPNVIGDSVFVVLVDTTSDAYQKGLRVGDNVLAIDGVRPTRDVMWRLMYTYRRLAPRQTVLLTVRNPDGRSRQLYIHTRVSPLERPPDLNDPEQRRRYFEELDRSGEPHVTVEFGDSVFLWRMPEFGGDVGNIDRFMGRARRGRALVLDLRNNPGGLITTLLRVAGHLFETDRDVMIVQRRHETRTMRARHMDRPYRGALVILVNGGSASSSEILSRLCQMTGRAVIVGDRSEGAVMVSRYYAERVVGETADLFFGLSISDADVMMPDSQRLEKHGVVPDTIVLPTGADLAAGRDPQLARALEIVGVHVSPEEAGRLYQRRR
jgi:C-terminal processing protease CtpA/Prc